MELIEKKKQMISKLHQQEGSEQDLDRNKTAITGPTLYSKETYPFPALYKRRKNKQRNCMQRHRHNVIVYRLPNAI